MVSTCRSHLRRSQHAQLSIFPKCSHAYNMKYGAALCFGASKRAVESLRAVLHLLVEEISVPTSVRNIREHSASYLCNSLDSSTWLPTILNSFFRYVSHSRHLKTENAMMGLICLSQTNLNPAILYRRKSTSVVWQFAAPGSLHSNPAAWNGLPLGRRAWMLPLAKAFWWKSH